jgi:hypothetical protein
MVDFRKSIESNPPSQLAALRADVISFARRFPVVGFTEDAMKFK